MSKNVLLKMLDYENHICIICLKLFEDIEGNQQYSCDVCGACICFDCFEEYTQSYLCDTIFKGSVNRHDGDFIFFKGDKIHCPSCRSFTF